MAKKPAIQKEPEMTQEVQTPTPTPVLTEPKMVHNKKLALVGDFGPESELTWFITKNPRSPGKATFDRFAKYIGMPTVSAYLAAGGTRGDLLWDLRSGYLSIQGVTLSGDPVVRVPKEKKAKVPKTPTVTAEGAQVPVGEPSAEVQALEKATNEETI